MRRRLSAVTFCLPVSSSRTASAVIFRIAPERTSAWRAFSSIIFIAAIRSLGAAVVSLAISARVSIISRRSQSVSFRASATESGT